MKLKNTSIKIKIMLPVAVIVVLLALSSLTSISIANNMLNVGTEISDNYSKSLVLLGDISEKFESLNSIIYKHCISTDDSVKSSLVQNYKTRTKEISNLCTQFEKKHLMQVRKKTTSMNLSQIMISTSKILTLHLMPVPQVRVL